MTPVSDSPNLVALNLPLDSIVPCPANPRQHVDDASLKELAASIAEKRVYEPILVRPEAAKNADGKPASYEIICGERRWRASKLAKQATIPAIVREMDDRQVLECQVIENLQRADLHPLDEAEGYRRLMSLNHAAPYTPEVLAEKVGKSKAYIYTRLQLLKLTYKLRDGFLKGELNLSTASRLARLQPRQQEECVAELRKYYPIAARAVENWTERNVLLELRSAPFATEDATLVPAAGSCEKCPKRTGNARLLFPEIKQKDLCTDPACFRRKLAALVEIKTAKFPGAVRVAKGDGWRSGEQHHEWAQAHIIPSHQYGQPGWVASAKDGCPYTQEAIVAAGDNKSVGQHLYVCNEPKCKVHAPSRGPYGPSSETPKQRVLRLAANREEKLKQFITSRTFRALFDHLAARKEMPTEAEARMLSRYVMDALGFYVLREHAEAFGFNPKQWRETHKDGHTMGQDEFMTEYAQQPKTVAGLLGALVAYAVWREAHDPGYIAGPNKATVKLSDYGIDPKQVAKNVRAELEAKKRRSKKPAAAKQQRKSTATCRFCNCSTDKACRLDGGVCHWIERPTAKKGGVCSNPNCVRQLQAQKRAAKKAAKKGGGK